MFKKLSGLLAIWCLLLCTGCLEFERQTLTFQYDGKADTLRIFQVYEGIFGGEQPAGLSEKELGELQSVLSGQRTFFFANWIWEYDRDEVRKGLDSIEKPKAQQDAKLDPATRLRRQSFLKLLLDNVHVENGAFYLDGQGKLCGTQAVTVSGFSKLIAAGNLQIQDLFKLEAAGEKVTAEERALYLKAAGQKQPFITLQGNQLRVCLPTTHAQFEKSFGPNSGAAKRLEAFKQQGGMVAFTKDEMKWSLGAQSGHATTLALATSNKPYVPNALDAVKSRATILEQLDVAAAAQAFVQGPVQKGKRPKP